MNNLRILVIGGEQQWQERLSALFHSLPSTVRVASSYETAVECIQHNRYDLVVLDLSLPEDQADNPESFRQSLRLFQELRNGKHNNTCALLVLSEYTRTSWTSKAIRSYNVYEFIEKNEFNHGGFLNTVRDAVLDARIRHTLAQFNTQYHLIVTFNRGSLVGSELTGPGNRMFYVAQKPREFDITNLTRRADELNLRVLRGETNSWRKEALDIGNSLYHALAIDQRIIGDLFTARALAGKSGNLVLQFSGPVEGLGSPFELLHDEGDYLGFDHILTRRLMQAGPSMSRKPESFHTFLKSLLDNGESLRILVVGANSDGNIPAAEAEAEAVAETIEADLQRLGITHEIHTLIGTQASYDEVSEALREGGYHIFHYAGHGRYDDKLPEVSGLVLQDGNTLHTLTANDLNFAIRDTQLRMVFLSCCLGTRTATSPGSGDFSGVLEALVRADVPIVLGYRWTVKDEPAKRLALDFYHELWRSFAPGQALLEARRRAASGEKGRANEAWASLILLMQNM